MNRAEDGSTFWITLDGLTSNMEYAFQYLIDGEIRIADPYAEKILDPWNDKYITDDIYPNLKSYLEGKTTEPVSVFQTAQAAYNWQITNFNPAKTTDLVIYEMLIRDFAENHTYKTIADTIGYLKRLGINVLELMPVNEFEGNSSWGYNPSFYFAPDKYYGPKNDLKLLIDECHKQGIAVVIDMVLNHSFGQSPFVRMYWDAANSRPASNNPWYNVEHNFQNPDAHWGYDFNHESDYTKKLVDSINSFWLNEYKVDGFRFDFTKGFSNTTYGLSDWGSAYDQDRINILKRMSDKIWEQNPNALVIFEHLSDNTEEEELADYGIMLWGNLNHAYCEGAMGWNTSGKSDFSWISYQKRGWENPHVVGYMESHDEERLMYKNLQWGNAEGEYNTKEIYTALRRMELAANFFIPIPGPKMIWQFGELGYSYSIDYNGRVGEKPIRWDYYDNGARRRIYEVMGYLNKLKVDESAFETEDYSLNVKNALKSMHLNHSDMDVVIIGNFDVIPGSIDPEFQQTGTWYEYYTGEQVDISDVNAEITLAPGEYRMYTTKQLDMPDINSSVGQNKVKELKVYPNPANDRVYFLALHNILKVEIFSINGQKFQFSDLNLNNIDVSDFKSGMYLFVATSDKGDVFQSRVIIQ